MGEMFALASADLKVVWEMAREELGAGGIQALLEKAEVLRTLRTLDTRSAAAIEPLMQDPSIGSVQIVERYPHHFISVDALESVRKRVKRMVKDGTLEPPNDRVIDLLRNEI